MSQSKKADPRVVIEDAWRSVQAYDAQHSTDRLAQDAPRFVDYAWKRFDPKTVLTVLMSEKPAYKALKPILFSGFCTWVVCPKRIQLRQHGMLLVGIEHMRWAEVLGRAAFAGRDIPNHDLLGDIMGRLRALGQDFYSDFYYPIGGLAQVVRSTTPRNFERSLAHHSKDALAIVWIMQIYDYHAKNLGNKELYWPASGGKGYELVRVLESAQQDKLGINEKASERRWKSLKSSAALIYAASTIVADEGQSLFEAICAGEATFEEHGDHLASWIGRARYAAETILGELTTPEIGQTNAALLPDITPEPTPEPPLSTVEKERIEAAFNRETINKGRREAERRRRLALTLGGA